MRIVATQQERDRVAAKVAWFEDNSRAERRRFERFVPIEPHSSLSLSSGETLPCTVIDYSIGGAAVFAEVTPAKGTALKIAKVVGVGGAPLQRRLRGQLRQSAAGPEIGGDVAARRLGQPV